MLSTETRTQAKAFSRLIWHYTSHLDAPGIRVKLKKAGRYMLRLNLVFLLNVGFLLLIATMVLPIKMFGLIYARVR